MKLKHLSNEDEKFDLKTSFQALGKGEKFDKVNRKYNDTNAKFVASYGWLRRLKGRPVSLM